MYTHVSWIDFISLLFDYEYTFDFPKVDSFVALRERIYIRAREARPQDQERCSVCVAAAACFA
jgi:hypothetical protein